MISQGGSHVQAHLTGYVHTFRVNLFLFNEKWGQWKKVCPKVMMVRWSLAVTVEHLRRNKGFTDAATNSSVHQFTFENLFSNIFIILSVVLLFSSLFMQLAISRRVHTSLALLRVLIWLWWLLALLLFWLFLLTIAGTIYLPKNLEQPLKKSFAQIDVENQVYLMCKVSWTSATQQLHACKSTLSLQLWQLRYTRFPPASCGEHAEQLLWWSAPLGKQKGGVYSPIFCF